MVLIGLEDKWTRVVLDYDIRDFKPIPCLVHFALTNFFADLALDVECFFTIIRMISIIYPHRASSFTKSKTLLIIFIIAIVLIPKNIFAAVIAKCVFKKTYKIYSVYLNFIVKTGIPAPINIYCTIRIIFALIAADKRRKKLVHAPGPQEKAGSESASKTKSLTTMLFLINTSFIVTYIPYFAFKFIPEEYLYNKNIPEQDARYDFIDQLFDIFYHLHHVLFCVYLMMASMFRKAMCSCLHSK